MSKPQYILEALVDRLDVFIRKLSDLVFQPFLIDCPYLKDQGDRHGLEAIAFGGQDLDGVWEA